MAMGKTYPAFLEQSGGVNPTGGDTRQGPYQDAAYTQGGAPAGRFFSETEFPVEAVSFEGMPAQLNGYRASDMTAPLPPPGSSVGFTQPPKKR